jgi:hypothetical protein
MSPVRTFNVLTLTTILLLAGCFGLGDSAEATEEADDTTVTATLTAQDIADAMTLSSNSPPELTVKEFYLDDEAHEAVDLVPNNWKDSGYFICTDDETWDEDPPGDTLDEQREQVEETIEEGEYLHLANLIEVGDCIAYFDFLSVDPDGDSMTKGIDTDFDGTIDIPIEPNHGLTMVSIDNSINRQVWNRWSQHDCEQIDVAFIAVDEHGASTVEFIHFFGIDSCDDDDDDGLMLWNFDDRDAAGDVTAAGGDDLVHVKMMQGSPLDWDLLGVSIVVDGGAMNNCVEASEADADGLQCTYTLPNSFSSWGVAEEITISEGANNDICDGVEGFCEIAVTLSRENADGTSMVIAVFTAIAQ